MTLMFSVLHSGGSTAAEEATFYEPYYIAGGTLVLLMGALALLLAFGKGREHS